MADDAERWRQFNAQHVYTLQELYAAACELAAMRVDQSADFIRYLHSGTDAELVKEFDGLIDGLLTPMLHHAREPDGRITPTGALSLLLGAVWTHEEELLRVEPEGDRAEPEGDCAEPEGDCAEPEGDAGDGAPPPPPPLPPE